MPRPSGLPIVEIDKVGVFVSHLEIRGRLNLLPRWRKRVAWLATGNNADVQALMVFAEPGLISIKEWEPDGPRIQQRAAELANSEDIDALEALRLIQVRYQRLIIPSKERPSLGHGAVAHLGFAIERGLKSTVYVCLFSDRIEIMSPAYRDSKLIEGHELIDDLP
jgi:hypothetical protein